MPCVQEAMVLPLLMQGTRDGRVVVGGRRGC